MEKNHKEKYKVIEGKNTSYNSVGAINVTIINATKNCEMAIMRACHEKKCKR